MPKSPYVMKRGNTFWFRRRPLIAQLSRRALVGYRPHDIPNPDHLTPSLGHLAVSLRTTCPHEARRRASHVNALFEYGWQRYDRALNNDRSHPDNPQQFAQGLLDILREQTKQMSILLDRSAPPAQVAAAQDRIDREARQRVDTMTPAPGRTEKPSTSIDDPEFEAALLDLADREGWWHDDPDEIIAQFDWMLVGLSTLQEEYVKYCARKGLDPATALPAFSRLAQGLSEVADSVGLDKGTQKPDAQAFEAIQSKAHVKNGSSPSKNVDPTRIKAFASRYLNLRAKGYALKRRHETPIKAEGTAFAHNSLRNTEASIRLFLEVAGNIPVADIQDHHCSQFIAMLERIPANHGKSAKDRRTTPEIVEAVEREERVQIDRVTAQMRSDGRSPGEIEEAQVAARIPRLSANTCVRHMRAISRLFDFAVIDGLRRENPMAKWMWTTREIASRRHKQPTAQRRGWGDAVHALLGSPIYREPLEEPGEPLFWAPLLGLFAGLRMEEALQLRCDDFSTENNIPFIDVQFSGGEQRLKAKASVRRVPIHPSLLHLGLLELVELRRTNDQNRIFTHLRRGKSKKSLSELFSKHFKRYRDEHGLSKKWQDFHALRHEFQIRLTHAGVPEHSRKALMGHAVNDVTHAHYYRDGDTIEMLRGYIDRIDIDYSDIRQPFGK